MKIHELYLLLALGLLAGLGLAHPVRGATLRFEPSFYRVTESAAAIPVTLVIVTEAWECPAGSEIHLESTVGIFSTARGTANPGEDFRPGPEIVDLSGSRHRISHRIRELLLDDQIPEGTETFGLTLDWLPSVRCTATDESVQLFPGEEATVEIVDDDGPALRIDGTQVPEGDTGTTEAFFRVRLDEASAYPVSVDLDTVNGTADHEDFRTTWSSPGTGNPVISGDLNFFSLPTPFPMVVGTWYRVQTSIHLENGQVFFGDICTTNEIWVRVEVLKSREPVLEVWGRDNLIKRIPLRSSR